MPTWSEILGELNRSTNQGRNPPDFDGIRRQYLVQLHQHTGRNTVLYATNFTQPIPNVPPVLLSIVDEDMQGLMEVIHGLPQDGDLDLILHSPGGGLAAAEAIVHYLRSKFTHIRVVVPHLAQSAATMIACAADEVVMGKHSFLGPTDPQFAMATPLGQRQVAARAVLNQFERAQKECKNKDNLPAWIPMLQQYGPDLLVKCADVCKEAQELVQRWLFEYMFRSNSSMEGKATDIARWLSNPEHHGMHERHIPRDRLEEKGLVVRHLEEDQQAQDLFLSVFHATTHTFTGTSAVKIIENHRGRAFIRGRQAAMQRGMQPPLAPPPVPSGPP